MNKPKFVYVTYIRTTPQKLWDALTRPEFTRQYWCETVQDCTWAKGAPWKLMIPDGRVGDQGVVLDIDPPRRLVLRWRNEFIPEMRAAGWSVCTFEIEPSPDGARLTVTHESETSDGGLIDKISQGWPAILSSLKTLLETGESLVQTRAWPKGM